MISLTMAKSCAKLKPQSTLLIILLVKLNLREPVEAIQQVCQSCAFVVPKVSTFESIKSLGLDLIDDDLLRTEITDFYELSLIRISTAEARFNDFSKQECLPYVSENFA